MNENKMSLAEIIRRCGYVTSPGEHQIFRCYLNGRNEMRKQTIDKLLKITGLTYEQAFGIVDGEQTDE